MARGVQWSDESVACPLCGKVVRLSTAKAWDPSRMAKHKNRRGVSCSGSWKKPEDAQKDADFYVALAKFRAEEGK